MLLIYIPKLMPFKFFCKTQFPSRIGERCVFYMKSKMKLGWITVMIMVICAWIMVMVMCHLSFFLCCHFLYTFEVVKIFHFAHTYFYVSGFVLSEVPINQILEYDSWNKYTERLIYIIDYIFQTKQSKWYDEKNQERI